MQKTLEQWKDDSRIRNIARICYTANREWCVINGDYSVVQWEHAPFWQTESCIEAVARCFYNMKVPMPSEMHAEWCRDKIADGWRHGSVKDVKHRLHPNIIPWSELPKVQRQKDFIFCALISSFLEGSS